MQPAKTQTSLRICSLIRVFAYRMCLLHPSGYPKRDKQEPLPCWLDVQADLSLCWSHRSYCRFCAMAHLRLSEYPSYLQQLCPMGGHSS